MTSQPSPVTDITHDLVNFNDDEQVDDDAALLLSKSDSTENVLESMCENSALEIAQTGENNDYGHASSPYYNVNTAINDGDEAAIRFYEAPSKRSILSQLFLSTDEATSKEHHNLECRRNRRSPAIIRPTRNTVIWKITNCITGVILVILLCVVILQHEVMDCHTNGSSSSSSPDSNHPDDGYKSFPYPHVRLPKSVVPERYDLFINPSLSPPYQVDGSANISLKIMEKDLNFLVFHSKASLNITSKKLQCSSAIISEKSATQSSFKSVKIVKMLRNKKLQQVYLKLGESLSNGSHCLLSMTFVYKLEPSLMGFYRSSYVIDGEKRWMASTQFEPVGARSAFPCWDEPSFKALFSLKIVRPSNLISLFNSPLNKSISFSSSAVADAKKKLVLDEYHPTVRMSTYLVAFIIGDLRKLSQRTSSNILVSVYTLPSQVEYGQWALDVGVKVITHYEKFFGLSYPLPKQDMVAIPNFEAGAMENWGLITFRETAILFNPKKDSVANKRIVTLVISHELAHQWFGNLVTMKWWNDLWLNEGFASFIQNYGINFSYPQMRNNDLISITGVLVEDSLSNSHPIEMNITWPDEIHDAFDGITYGKGSALLRMLCDALLLTNLQKGLSTYLTHYRYANAETKDLWRYLNRFKNQSMFGNDITVNSMMESWTKQTGYPVVMTELMKGPGNVGVTLRLTQKRFVSVSPINITKENTISDNDDDELWVIPFTFTISSSPNTVHRVWMNKKRRLEIPLSISNDDTLWLKGNHDRIGFYRVNYPRQLWLRFSEILLRQQSFTAESNGHFSSADRECLLDDSFALSFVNLTTADVFMELTRYLSNGESSFNPWSTALSHFEYIDERLNALLPDDALKLKKFVRQLTKPMVSKMFRSADDLIRRQNFSEDPQRSLMRSLFFSSSINFDDEKVTTMGKEIFDRWVKNSSLEIPGELKKLIFVCGVRIGGRQAFDEIWKYYLRHDTFAAEKSRALSSLSYVTDPVLINRLLIYTLNSSLIKSQDISTVYVLLTSTTIGHLLSWQFIRQRWHEVYAILSDSIFHLSRVVQAMISRFSTKFDYDEVMRFFADKPRVLKSRPFKQGLERIQRNMEWSKNNLESVSSWLKHNVN